jgi:hypothetical protein
VLGEWEASVVAGTGSCAGASTGVGAGSVISDGAAARAQRPVLVVQEGLATLGGTGGP